jgi:hypothetical protein
MEHVLVLNLIFFVPAVSGAAACAWWLVRILRTPARPVGDDGDGGGAVRALGPESGSPRAGPNDLARSA